MISNPGLIHLLRVVHIVGGVFWVGSAFFFIGFLAPAIRGAGPAGGAVMDQLARVRKLPLYMMLAMVLTVLSGIALYWNSSLGFEAAWMASGPGLGFGIGGLLGIVGGSIGMTVNGPLAGALAVKAQAAGANPTPDQAAELHQLRGRLDFFMKLVGFLLFLATAGMAVARYLP